MKQVGKNTQLIEAFKACEEEQGAGAVLYPRVPLPREEAGQLQGGDESGHRGEDVELEGAGRE